MNERSLGLSTTVLAGSDLLVLTRFLPDWSRLVHGLGAPHAWIDVVGVDSAATSVAGALLWLTALWLAVGLAATLASVLPGRIGAMSAAVAHSVMPAALRKLVIGAAGVSIVISPATALADAGNSAAAFNPTSSTSARSAAPSAAVDWPSDRTSAPAGDWSAAAPQTSAVPPIIWPTDAAGTTTARAGNAPQTVAVQTPKPTPSPRAAGPASTLAPKHSPAGAGHSQIDPPDATTPIVRTPTAGSRPNVRVTAGDSLWLIAAHRLGPKATEAEIAGAWPQWYAANHRAIGDNPNALTPGARLSVPDAKD